MSDKICYSGKQQELINMIIEHKIKYYDLKDTKNILEGAKNLKIIKNFMEKELNIKTKTLRSIDYITLKLKEKKD